MSKRSYKTPTIMHDFPVRDGAKADFHFEDFAATLARLVASRNTETPLVIGVNGAWGSGKTSLLWLVQDMLANPKGKGAAHRFAQGEEKDFRVCKTVWFDAWKYNDEDKLLVALVRVILQTMQRDGFLNKLKAWLEDPTQKSYDVVAMFINAFEASFGGLGVEFKFKPDLKKHEEPSQFEKHTAFFDYFDDAFTTLLSAWAGDGTLVVFIDDLDRCLPAKTVQTLEAIKLFLDKKGCVFMLGADTKIVQMAVETHYKNAGITGESAKDYLEKIIQLRFDLPPILEGAMESFLRDQGADSVDEIMLGRWETLVAAAEVNPRRVKNVINDLNLQWYMALNSGQAEGVNRNDFVCWQAIMRAAPAKFAVQIMDIEDKKLRHNFLMDALKWQTAPQEEQETVKGFFKDYEDRDSKRLRGVLKQVAFSAEFTPEALDAMIYLTAPPEPQKTAPEAKIASPVDKVETLPEEALFEKEAQAVMRGEAKGVPVRDRNRLVIGGVEFVKIPAGAFLMGSRDDNEWAYDSEKPQHSVELPDYWMCRFILTNEQYAEFLGKKKHPVSDWQKKKDHPVVNVSWDDAMAYCKSFNETYGAELQKAGGLTLRLPTEAEWEKAARGAYANEWPWGNEFDPKKCNSVEGKKGGTTPVGAYSSAGGDSPYGCADMIGNVWEWTHTLWKSYPYKADDGREDESSRNRRVLRGGSFDDLQRYARCAFRHYYLAPDGRHNFLGFRVCASPIIHL